MKIEIPKLLIIKFTVLFFFVIFVGLFLYLKNPLISDLRINEVSFSNKLGYDWVEIYNPSLQTKTLKGMYLTDDKLDLDKYEIDKDVLVEPNSYIVIYSENYEGEENVIKLNFDISNGETVYLIEKRDLTVVDSLTVLSEEDDLEEESVGRFPNGANEIFIFSTTSMGEANIKDHIHGPDSRKIINSVIR